MVSKKTWPKELEVLQGSCHQALTVDSAYLSLSTQTGPCWTVGQQNTQEAGNCTVVTFDCNFQCVNYKSNNTEIYKVNIKHIAPTLLFIPLLAFASVFISLPETFTLHSFYPRFVPLCFSLSSFPSYPLPLSDNTV